MLIRRAHWRVYLAILVVTGCVGSLAFGNRENQVVTMSNLVWSVDSRFLTFTASLEFEESHVYVVRANGDGLSTIENAPYSFELNPEQPTIAASFIPEDVEGYAFSPDERFVAFIICKKDDVDCAEPELQVMNALDEFTIFTINGHDLDRATPGYSIRFLTSIVYRILPYLTAISFGLGVLFCLPIFLKNWTRAK